MNEDVSSDLGNDDEYLSEKAGKKKKRARANRLYRDNSQLQSGAFDVSLGNHRPAVPDDNHGPGSEESSCEDSPPHHGNKK